jgi:hypothetical protein
MSIHEDSARPTADDADDRAAQTAAKVANEPARETAVRLQPVLWQPAMLLPVLISIVAAAIFGARFLIAVGLTVALYVLRGCVRYTSQTSMQPNVSIRETDATVIRANDET